MILHALEYPLVQQQKQEPEHIHYDIQNINFAIGENSAITCTVQFDSTHPEETGNEISRTFDRDVTIMEILEFHITDFPSWPSY